MEAKTQLDPTRQALAEAIEKWREVVEWRERAQEAWRKANDAEDEAIGERIEASKHLASVEQEIESGDIGGEEAVKKLSEARARLATAEAKRDYANEVMKAATKQRDDATHGTKALVRHLNVKDRIKGVVSSSGAVDKLVARYKRKAAEAEALRRALAMLDVKSCLPPQHRFWESVPDLTPEDLMVVAAWTSALMNLETDPETPLPA